MSLTHFLVRVLGCSMLFSLRRNIWTKMQKKVNKWKLQISKWCDFESLNFRLNQWGMIQVRCEKIRRCNKLAIDSTRVFLLGFRAFLEGLGPRSSASREDTISRNNISVLRFKQTHGFWGHRVVLIVHYLAVGSSCFFFFAVKVEGKIIRYKHTQYVPRCSK